VSDLIPSADVGSDDLVTGTLFDSDVFKRDLYDGLLLHVYLSVRLAYRKEFDDFYCINFEVIKKFDPFLTSRKLIN